VYERHDPFAQALHQVVRENLATFYAAIEEGWQTERNLKRSAALLSKARKNGLATRRTARVAVTSPLQAHKTRRFFRQHPHTDDHDAHDLPFSACCWNACDGLPIDFDEHQPWRRTCRRRWRRWRRRIRRQR
jgi:hypothetical protein